MSGDHSFEHSFRVAIALERLGLHETGLAEQWRECALRWGPLSPAALGCLLELVRRAFGLDMFVVALTRDGGRWEVWARGSDDGPFAWGSTEAQALVEALELRSEAFA